MSVQTTGSALAEVISDSRGTRGGGTPSLSQQQQKAFTDRSRSLRERMVDICKQGVDKHTAFDAVFKDVQTHWDNGHFAGQDVERAFTAVDEALDAAEDRIAEHLEELKALEQKRGEFSAKLTGLRDRAGALVYGKFAAWTDFDPAFAVLQGLWDRSEVVGGAADKAFDDLEKLVAAAEKKVKFAELYNASLATTQQNLAELQKDTYLPVDALDTAKASIEEAKKLAAARDHEGAVGKLRAADRQIGAARKRAEQEKEIADNRETLLSDMWERNLKESGVKKEDVEQNLSEEQVSELVRLEKQAQEANTPSKRKPIRRKIRERYDEIVEELAAAAEDEEDEEPPPVVTETSTQRLERIDKLKRQFKSTTALLTLDKENEIFRTREAFSNRGSNFSVGVGSIADYVAGYDVFLRNSPPDSNGDRTQYRKMVVHFHFSDRAMTKIERAHFKNSHAGSDKSHVLIKTADQSNALTVCRKYL
jgi:hypothetical protein